MSIGNRCARAAAVGGGLGVLLVLVLVLPDWKDSDSGCPSNELCLGIGFLLVPVLVLLTAIVAWPLLRAVGVRPAWAPALVGPFIAWALFESVLEQMDGPNTPDWAFPAIVLLAVLIGYTGGAFISAPGLSPRWRVPAIVVFVALLLWEVRPYFPIGL
jgi:hypothetical protein